MHTISVITICFNNLPELLQTIASVDQQSQAPFEHWIIDGSSNDEIKNYLDQHPQPAYRKWLTERDKGIADAFNKGIARASGDIVNMLNSGDCLFDSNTIATVTRAFTGDPGIDWVHGKYRLQRGNTWVIIGKPFDKKKLYRGMRSICHQSMFLKKKLHDQYGLYDTNEKIGMDYDFLCRMREAPFSFIPIPLVIFAPAGISSNSYLRSLKDTKSIYEKHFGKSFKTWLWQIRLKGLYYLLRSPVGNFLYKVKTRLKLENM
jgi:glycosyltransferase involved in cell wall biosynthesis